MFDRMNFQEKNEHQVNVLSNKRKVREGLRKESKFLQT